ncbi:hypothetical protein QR680_007900 [Steinernema hermaphroditum]|uniref:Uncharacterized protein n=1 Tax=Steinernema hermaphroditum TaxID=289476 RepID=A0AA39IG07_9BILA|nr:hypothetical protein QR680_007900 [Steinernema hermaphroditum]
MWIAKTLLVLNIIFSATSVILISIILVKINNNWEALVHFVYDGGDVSGTYANLCAFTGLLSFEIFVHVVMIAALYTKTRIFLFSAILAVVIALFTYIFLSFELIIIDGLDYMNSFLKTDTLGHSLYGIVCCGGILRLTESVHFSKICVRIRRESRRREEARKNSGDNASSTDEDWF